MSTTLDPVAGLTDLMVKLRAQMLAVQATTSHQPDNDTIREVLPVVGETLAVLQQLEQIAFEWRMSLWRQGRSNTPPITNPELGRLANVSEVAVMKQLKKYRDSREAGLGG